MPAILWRLHSLKRRNSHHSGHASIPAANRVTRSAVNKFVQLLWIIYTIIQRQIILKATVILPGCCTTSDTLWTQIRNILNGEERIGIKDMGGLTATVADNTLFFGLIKSPSIQRVWVIPKVGRPVGAAVLSRSAFLFGVLGFGIA